jgi:rRNA maturation RNase YbeY
VPVRFHTEDISFNLSQKLRHKRWICLWVESQKKACGELNIIFVSNAYLRRINRNYLNHDYNTDVITFDLELEGLISGDIYISPDQVKINADNYGTEEAEELRRVMIHGVNHLLGYNDRSDEEKEIMRQMENEALHLWLKEV